MILDRLVNWQEQNYIAYEILMKVMANKLERDINDKTYDQTEAEFIKVGHVIDKYDDLLIAANEHEANQVIERAKR